MSSPTPILDTSLPSTFRQIRIELAREHGHPDGARDIAYVLVAPLDDEGHIDPELWREHREACRVAPAAARAYSSRPSRASPRRLLGIRI